MPDKKWIALILVVVVLLIAFAALDQGKQWDGVDSAVVGRFGTELGSAPAKPLLNLQGDALLFAFTISGTIGGFVAGYYWRELFGRDARLSSGKPVARGLVPRSDASRRDKRDEETNPGV